MGLHGATFVAPLPGTPPIGMSATDGRLVMGGLFGTTPQLVAGGGISQSGSNMQFTIAQSVFQLPDVTNAAATAFLPTDSTVLTPAVGPGTGSRIDLICIPFKNYENGDPTSQSQPILVAGTAGTPGVAPPVPAGSYKYAQITVGTGVTTAAACTVQTFGNTTFAPPDLLATTLVRLRTVSGTLGQLAIVTADTLNNGVYMCMGGTTWSPFTTTNMQSDTTNSVAQTITQIGIGKITGAAACSISEAVTFPVPFSGIPIVEANYIGGRTPNGAYNPAGLVEVAPLTLGKPTVPSATGFTMVIVRTDANLTATYDYYYSWTAIGVPA